MKMKGNIMTKKTIVFLVGVVVFVFVAMAVYAATDTGQNLTNDNSITNVEVTNTEAYSQDERDKCCPDERDKCCPAECCDEACCPDECCPDKCCEACCPKEAEGCCPTEAKPCCTGEAAPGCCPMSSPPATANTGCGGETSTATE